MGGQQIALGLSYEGSSFYGWQRQPDLPTIQGELEKALGQIANHPVDVRVAGRTDAGVHASGQIASFFSDARRSPADWLRGVNGLTPASISLDWVQAVPDTFHPRYSATARTYHYLFHDVPRPEPALVGRVWSCQNLDGDLMHRGAQLLLGEHDFSGFRGAGCQSLTPMRRVNRCQVYRKQNFIVLEIEANAFLLHMVRNIARGLHDLGRHGDLAAFGQLLAGRDRTRLGATAPADGLYLTRVSYPGFDLPPSRPPFFLSL